MREAASGESGDSRLEALAVDHLDRFDLARPLRRRRERFDQLEPLLGIRAHPQRTARRHVRGHVAPLTAAQRPGGPIEYSNAEVSTPRIRRLARPVGDLPNFGCTRSKDCERRREPATPPGESRLDWLSLARRAFSMLATLTISSRVICVGSRSWPRWRWSSDGVRSWASISRPMAAVLSLASWLPTERLAIAGCSSTASASAMRPAAWWRAGGRRR